MIKKNTISASYFRWLCPSHLALTVLLWFLLIHQTLIASTEQPSKEPQYEHKEADALFVSKMTHIQDMESTFKQWILDERGDQIQETEGRIKVIRPRKFSWETNEPFPQLIVSNGDTLWIYDKDLEQVTKQRLDTRIGNTPALLISGSLDKISEEFEITSEQIDNNAIRFLLKPLTADHQFVRLSMVIQGEALREMHLEDALGQKTLIEFSGMQVNEGLANSLFEFQPPEGVDVIEDE